MKFYSFVFLLALTAIGQNFYTMSNKSSKIELDLSSGTIKSISAEGVRFVGDVFSLIYDDKTVNSFTLTEKSDTLVIFDIADNGISLQGRIKYHLRSSMLEVSTELFFKDSVSLTKGIGFGLSGEFESAKTFVPGYSETSYDLSKDDIEPAHLEHITSFSGTASGISFLNRNPYHSFWQFNEGRKGHHVYYVIPYTPPNAIELDGIGKGPLITSCFGVSDTIRRVIEVPLAKDVSCPVVLSEHKDGASSAITMYWDELPGKQRHIGQWEFFTTADDEWAVMYDHYYLRLLEEHPKMIMGHLLITDILLYRDPSDITSWEMNSPYIIADSLCEKDGQWCLNLIAPELGTYKAYQGFKCEPNKSYELIYDIKTEDIVSETGAYAEVYFNSPWQIARGPKRIGTNDWQRDTVRFKADAESLIVYLRIEEGIGNAYFDNVILRAVDGDTNLISNGGFEEHVSKIVYDNPRKHWSDARGVWYTPNASDEYKKFLKRIEDDDTLYGWEHRMRLGSHGLHHSPNLTTPDNEPPCWEFQWYDPVGDSLRVDKIFSNTYATGLTDKSLRFFRSPGFQYTRSLLNRLIKHDVPFFDAAKRWCDNYYAAFFQADGHRMWLISQCWWGDLMGSHTMGSEIIHKRLNRGHLAHLGGHPSAMFHRREEENYQRINKIFYELEDSFPNMQYVFPDDYADYANAIYENQMHYKSGKDTVKLEIEGDIVDGTSILIPGECSKVTLNGTIVPLNNSKGRNYAVLPAVSGRVTSEVIIYNFKAIENVAFEENSSKQSLIYTQVADKLYFNLSQDEQIVVELYNVLGQRIMKKAIDNTTQRWVDLSSFSNSILFMKVFRANSELPVTKKVFIK